MLAWFVLTLTSALPRGWGGPTVAGDKKTGRAECDEWGAIDAESVEELKNSATWWLPLLEAVAIQGKTGMDCRLFGKERLPNQAGKVDT